MEPPGQVPAWENGPGEVMNTLMEVACRPCEAIDAATWEAKGHRCPRGNSCSPCHTFWMLLNDRTPVTWVVVSAYWMAKISS